MRDARRPDDVARLQLELMLHSWARNNDLRDRLVRTAHTLGVSKNRIYEITGLARTTVDRILSGHDDARPPE